MLISSGFFSKLADLQDPAIFGPTPPPLAFHVFCFCFLVGGIAFHKFYPPFHC